MPSTQPASAHALPCPGSFCTGNTKAFPALGLILPYPSSSPRCTGTELSCPAFLLRSSPYCSLPYTACSLPFTASQ